MMFNSNYKIIFFLILLFLSNLGYSQLPNKHKKELLKENWSSGKVKLKDGTVAQGEIDYKEITGMVLFKINEEKTSYTAEHLISFEIYDEENNVMNKYISLPFDYYNSGYEKFTFFQVSYESKNIAFISRTEFESKEKTYYGGSSIPGSISTPYGSVATRGTTPVIDSYDIFEEREIFYLANALGLMKPCIKNTYKIVDNLIKFKGSSFVEKEALEEILQDKYDECEKYANENNLSLKNKDDILKILEYSESLN